jgi:DNA-directed RNA polymerase specialized sigma24 family protein
VDVPDHPKRPVRLPPGSFANVASTETEGALIERLYAALSEMPPDERLAAMVCFGLAEGSTGVAVELDLDEEDAEALARSALQRLRGALGDAELNEPELFARLDRRRRRTSEPGAASDHT